jgi:hypothetical protein
MRRIDRLINCLFLGMLSIVGCTTQHRPDILGRWKVSGTDNVVTLKHKDHSARLTSRGKTMIGSFEPLAPDLLNLTFPGNGPQSIKRIITYKVPLDGRAGRSLKAFTDTETNISPNAK